MSTCVQCSREMKFATDVQKKQVPICNYHDCPNFGLLQLGNEIMSEFAEKEEKEKIDPDLFMQF